ncbi:hypothetical protein [Planctomyces sp. SH-PL14]|uniref:hypothetical protein n=1 Tax=Planctomyces sp. SH-PL14 TaxID=1632864 RepID=UPI0012E72F1D|nr:hypothetical protein [Planctomyces sp. SH-PL14]
MATHFQDSVALSHIFDPHVAIERVVDDVLDLFQAQNLFLFHYVDHLDKLRELVSAALSAKLFGGDW